MSNPESPNRIMQDLLVMQATQPEARSQQPATVANAPSDRYLDTFAKMEAAEALELAKRSRIRKAPAERNSDTEPNSSDDLARLNPNITDYESDGVRRARKMEQIAKLTAKILPPLVVLSGIGVVLYIGNQIVSNTPDADTEPVAASRVLDVLDCETPLAAAMLSSTGEQVWKFTLPDGTAGFLSPPVVDKDNGQKRNLQVSIPETRVEFAACTAVGSGNPIDITGNTVTVNLDDIEFHPTFDANTKPTVEVLPALVAEGQLTPEIVAELNAAFVDTKEQAAAVEILKKQTLDVISDDKECGVSALEAVLIKTIDTQMASQGATNPSIVTTGNTLPLGEAFAVGRPAESLNPVKFSVSNTTVTDCKITNKEGKE